MIDYSNYLLWAENNENKLLSFTSENMITGMGWLEFCFSKVFPALVARLVIGCVRLSLV